MENLVLLQLFTFTKVIFYYEFAMKFLEIPTPRNKWVTISFC
jgi:hypothetical protein